MCNIIFVERLLTNNFIIFFSINPKIINLQVFIIMMIQSVYNDFYFLFVYEDEKIVSQVFIRICVSSVF